MSKNKLNIKKKKEKMKKNFRLTLMMLSVLFLLFFVGIYRVYLIKANNGDEYETIAIENQVNRVQDTIINPNRGSIFDRNNQVLAISKTVYNLVLDIRVITELEYEKQLEILNTINKETGISTEELLPYLAMTQDGKPVNDTNWKIVKKKLDYETGRNLEKHKLKGVYLEEDTLRAYPHNNLASQVIGFVRGDTSWGLEKQYNDEMTGKPGRVFRTYEDNNNIVTQKIYPTQGNSIITTLDLNIQQFAEDIIKETYESSKPEYTPESVSLMVMNPKTGEILAMAEYPNFNLNEPTQLSLENDLEYKEYIKNSTDDEKINTINKVWKNFLVSSTFEPGSTFKPLVVAAALEENAINLNDTYFCNGFKIYDKYKIRCHNRNGHGKQTLEEALANSCNIAMMDIVEKLGKEGFYKYQKEFGFGEKLGIDLPGEVDAASLIYKLNQLNKVELATSSFGQGFNSTALQSLVSFASLINGGNLLKPYLVSQISDENGSVVKEYSPTVIRKVVSEETSDYFRKILQKVVSESGTAKAAIIPGYNIGGKTGTAQQGVRSDDMYTLSFIAYFPVEDPEYIAMSIIHRPKKYVVGKISPVPMIKELFEKIISYKAIKPSSNIENYEQKSFDNEIFLNDYTNKTIKETIKELNSIGIDFQIVGGGGNLVTKQFPIGNSKISKDTKVLIYTDNDESQKDLIVVPDVSGMDVNAAKEVLFNLGFEVNLIDEGEIVLKEEYTENVNSYSIEIVEQDQQLNKKVVEQLPKSNIKLEKGTEIKIKVK